MLKYLVNMHFLDGIICQWLLLFEEFTFEVIVKWGRFIVGLDDFSRLESRESGGSIHDHLPDAHLFHIEVVPNYLEYFPFSYYTSMSS